MITIKEPIYSRTGCTILKSVPEEVNPNSPDSESLFVTFSSGGSIQVANIEEAREVIDKFLDRMDNDEIWSEGYA